MAIEYRGNAWATLLSDWLARGLISGETVLHKALAVPVAKSSVGEVRMEEGFLSVLW
jgi:hypothetical protein